VQLGMTADEVRKKLGDPKDKVTNQDFFIFTKAKPLQIVTTRRARSSRFGGLMTAGASVPTANKFSGLRLKQG